MLHSVLSAYLSKIEQHIDNLTQAYIEKYEEEILTFERGNLKIRIRFDTGHLLEINEAMQIISGQIIHLDYRYHFQNSHNQLIFRYDSTPHF